MKKSRLGIAVAAGLLATSSLAQAAVKNLPVVPAAKAGLNAEQVKKLKALGIKIMVPAYLPKGFKVAQVHTEHLKHFGPGSGQNYQIGYAGPANTSFEMQAATSGLGDIMGDSEKTLTHPLLGKVAIMYMLPGGMLPKSEKMSYATQWLDAGTQQRFSLSTPAIIGSKLKPSPMAQAEFNKVLNSVGWLQ